MKAIGYEGYQGPRLTRQEQLARMHRVIENELTEKQRRAVLGYYVDKKDHAGAGAGVRRLQIDRLPHHPARRAPPAPLPALLKPRSLFQNNEAAFEKKFPRPVWVGAWLGIDGACRPGYEVRSHWISCTLSIAQACGNCPSKAVARDEFVSLFHVQLAPGALGVGRIHPKCRAPGKRAAPAGKAHAPA